MVTDNISQQTSTRLWALMSAALFALGGIWLQNQYNTQQAQAEQMIALQRQQNEMMKYVNERYVDKDYFNSIGADQRHRMNVIEGKLDRLIEMNSGNGSRITTPKR